MYNSDMPSRAELPSSNQLIRSTLIALGTAAVLLIAIVLPAEYGIDPTGIGGVLNLTEMGEIKQQLAAEAEADAADSSSTTAPEPGLDPLADNDSSHAAGAVDGDTTVVDTEALTEPTGDGWRDEFSLTLSPAQGKEIKLVMSTGDTVTYEWTVDQGHLNSDLHTDNGPSGRTHSYRQGRAETEVANEFTAVSEGAHGWFWRNRSEGEVTVTLRVRGDYSGVKGAG